MIGLLAASLLLAQPVTQFADAAGDIVGRVLIRGENQPVAGARVTFGLIRHGPGSASTPPAPPTVVLTGPDGVYRRLPAERFDLRRTVVLGAASGA